MAAGKRAEAAMQKNHFDLVSTIEPIVGKMTAALYDKGLITDEKMKEASIIVFTDFKKAGILVDCVRSTVTYPTEKINIDAFITILRQLDPKKDECPVAISLEKGMIASFPVPISMVWGRRIKKEHRAT